MTTFIDFLWNNKGDKIKRNVITQNYGNGGLGTIDIASFNKALTSVLTRKYLDERNKGGQTAFKGNLDIKASKKLANNLSPLLKDILEIWSALNYQGSIEMVELFLTRSLWYNSLIRVMDKIWYQMRVSHVRQIIKEQQSPFLLPTEFERKYRIVSKTT